MFGRGNRKEIVETVTISETSAMLRQNAFYIACDSLKKTIEELDCMNIKCSADDFKNPPPQKQEQKSPQEALKNASIKGWHIVLSKLGCEDRIEEIISKVNQEIKKGQSK